jgi:hypothetical protein
MKCNNGLIAVLTYTEANTQYSEPPFKHPHTVIDNQESHIAFRVHMETILSKLIHENKEAPPSLSSAMAMQDFRCSTLSSARPLIKPFIW